MFVLLKNVISNLDPLITKDNLDIQLLSFIC